MSVIPKRQRRKAEINIVPLIDVLVVLIFFFLVSMQFRNLNMLNLTLPKVETAGNEDPVENLRVAIDTEGKFYLNSNPIEQDQLGAAVAQIAQRNPGISVLIVADENSLLQKVTFAMDVCRKAGLEKIRLQAR